jgi:hypothetical protein
MAYKEQLLKIAEQWPKSHLDDYIKGLEGQTDELKELIQALKTIQKRKQKEIDRKLRDSGPRGAT